eukprot:scaffold325_cov230-Pinguiococcus_pyrenoidosus.AAC.7
MENDQDWANSNVARQGDVLRLAGIFVLLGTASHDGINQSRFDFPAIRSSFAFGREPYGTGRPAPQRPARRALRSVPQSLVAEEGLSRR